MIQKIELNKLRETIRQQDRVDVLVHRWWIAFNRAKLRDAINGDVRQTRLGKLVNSRAFIDFSVRQCSVNKACNWERFEALARMAKEHAMLTYRIQMHEALHEIAAGKSPLFSKKFWNVITDNAINSALKGTV